MHSTTSVANINSSALWHPCSQMKDYETFAPLEVVSAKGSYIHLANGRRIIDAISSWWCKSLGHGHPRLVEALVKQANQFEHVILANTINNKVAELSEKLTGLTSQLKKVFYASDGSCAVEIALKLTHHARLITGQRTKTKVLALQNGYHGETLFALAASDVGLYRQPYEAILPKIKFIQSIPYVSSRYEPEWNDSSRFWQLIEPMLEGYQETLSAIILEPILQGAGGMLVYSQDFLRRLRRWCRDHDVYLIADEIMTGFGRTGKMFACEHAQIEPDLLCFGKGITSGMVPFSGVLMTDGIYRLFYDNYESGKSFLHSHTYSGYALGAAVALECVKVFEEERIVEQVQDLELQLHQAMHDIADQTKKITAVRGIGGVVAADLIPNGTSRLGYQVYQKAVHLGALLRPLGNTIYWLPPLNIKSSDIKKLAQLTRKAIVETYG